MQSEIEIALHLQMFYSLTAQCSFILQFYLHNNIYECVCVRVCLCVCKPYFPPEHSLFNAYILQYSVKIVIQSLETYLLQKHIDH